MNMWSACGGRERPPTLRPRGSWSQLLFVTLLCMFLISFFILHQFRSRVWMKSTKQMKWNQRCAAAVLSETNWNKQDLGRFEQLWGNDVKNEHNNEFIIMKRDFCWTKLVVDETINAGWTWMFCSPHTEPHPSIFYCGDMNSMEYKQHQTLNAIYSYANFTVH